MTSVLPRTPPIVPVDHVLTSALPHPPIMPVDDVLISALSRPSTLVGPPSREDVVTSALPRPLTVPGDLPYVDNAIQRPADSVDNRNNVCTHSIERLLADLTPPPHVCGQSVPLLPDHTQASASEYILLRRC